MSPLAKASIISTLQDCNVKMSVMKTIIDLMRGFKTVDPQNSTTLHEMYVNAISHNMKMP